MNRERMPHKTFSLENNPFRVLKANYRSSAAEISDLVEDAELDGLHHEDELQTARQALVTPKSRLLFELSWLPELSQLQKSKLEELLRQADPAVILTQIDHFPDLARANIAAHLCSKGNASIEVVHSLAQSWDELDEAHLLKFLNEERRSSGFPAVEANQLRDGLRDIRQRHAAAAANWIWSLPLPGKRMNELVEQELERNPEGSFLRHLVEVYDKESEPHLAVIKESVLTATAAARKVSADLPQHIKEIERLLEAWDSINQPVQVYSQFRGQEEGRSKQLYEIVRKLCLELANDHGRYEEALRLSSALLTTFPELESVAESLKEDITALESLSQQKKISDKLDPLVEACERAKKNASSFGNALRSDGFSESGGKILTDVVKSFNDARKSLPEPGVAYLIVRDLALSLNNESNDPQSAFLLVDGLIDLGSGKGPKEVLEKLREERAILHKNWKMKELERQGGNLNGMLRVVDDMLVFASPADRRDLEKLKSKIEGKRFAKKAKFVLFAGIGAVILYFVLMDEFSKPASRTTYSPPVSERSTAAALPSVSDPYQEDMPPVGTGRSLTRNQVRYCIFQGVRLDYIRPLTTTNSQIDRFNAMVADFNARCGSFRYTSGVLEAVEREVAGRSAALRADAQRIVSSW
ncbi:MAG: hypothetical protein KDE03_16415 [Rhodobacteraceae bacterium]|nr:hypothetical protein [Xanthomonadales bacterium]MCB2130603.1 hypothetical protein [Paracoccaceae bacterium]